MSDLFNEFPSWGETGEYPNDGFFYSGGDQVNEKHLDALWNGIDKHVGNINNAIEERVRDLDGDVVLDGGLVTSTGAGTREVDVSSSVGAYVDGHKVENVGGVTLTLSANGGSLTRTDVIYPQEDGTVAVDSGTASAPAEALKIAEADVEANDTISDVRNDARDLTEHIASENEPAGSPGDTWHDLSTDERKAYVNGSYKIVATNENTGDSFSFSGNVEIPNGDLDLGENNINSVNNIEGHSSAFSNLNTNGQPWRVRDTTNSQDIAKFNEGGNVKIPNGNLSEQGNRVATRTWVNNNTTAYTDEKAQDAVGSGFTSPLTYDDANNQFGVDEAAISLSNLSGYPIGTGDLGFDTATQTELNGHANSTNNPHNVTDSQTGAASALSSHAGDADAHHAAPTLVASGNGLGSSEFDPTVVTPADGNLIMQRVEAQNDFPAAIYTGNEPAFWALQGGNSGTDYEIYTL